MSNPWRHLICEECWHKREPDRDPIVLREEFRDPPQRCCYCGVTTQSGIYVRQDPHEVVCCGIGSVHT